MTMCVIWKGELGNIYAATDSRLSFEEKKLDIALKYRNLRVFYMNLAMRQMKIRHLSISVRLQHCFAVALQTLILSKKVFLRF
jgi:hypothetical protein